MAATKKQSAPKKLGAKKPAGTSVRKQAAASRPAPSKKSAPKKTAPKPATKRAAMPATKTTANSDAVPKPAPAPRRPKPEVAPPQEIPKARFSKENIGYTRDFDLSFVREQYDALQEERIRLTGQANRLEEEAHQLVEEAEMGDVQFDDEGGEGDTMVVERERDHALSAQAREAVVEIDDALARIALGTYGYSTQSGRPLPRERLEAIPWASVLVEEKVGGIGRR
jgi:RNA polymerase-binding transcription factor DksA